MRVAFLTPWDVASPRSWSGVVRPMYRALESRAEVVPLVTSEVRDALVDRALCRAVDGHGGRYLPGHALSTAFVRGRFVSRALEQIRPDVILAVAASQDLAFLRSPAPVVQVSDITWAALADYYPLYTQLHPLLVPQARLQARLSTRRVAHTLAATDWARRRLMLDDGVADSAISVAPFGPAIASSISVPRATGPGMRALMVASDWRRKGGPAVVEAVEGARAEGVQVSLRIVGDPKLPSLPDWAEVAGRVDPEGMAAEYANADILIELAQSSASGVVLTDAAAAGLPVVARRTGGVATVVDHGTTGWLVAGADPIVEAVGAIRSLADPAVRSSMGEAARKRHEALLNWERWADAAQRAFERVTAENE